MIVATIFLDCSDVFLFFFMGCLVPFEQNHVPQADTWHPCKFTVHTCHGICKSGGSPGANYFAAGFDNFMPHITVHVCKWGCKRRYFYRSGAKVVVILSGVGLETESADPRSCVANQATQTIMELAKHEIRILIWHHAKVCICKSE